MNCSTVSILFAAWRSIPTTIGDTYTNTGSIISAAVPACTSFGLILGVTQKFIQYTDQVCGMDVHEESEHRFRFEGVEYYFCSDHCRRKFAADPQHYLPDQAGSEKAEVEHEHGACCHGHSGISSEKSPRRRDLR